MTKAKPDINNIYKKMKTNTKSMGLLSVLLWGLEVTKQSWLQVDAMFINITIVITTILRIGFVALLYWIFTIDFWRQFAV